MESQIWREKIMLVYDISHLEEKDLAREMMEKQVSNKWPGLVDEVKELCETMSIEDPRMT